MGHTEHPPDTSRTTSAREKSALCSASLDRVPDVHLLVTSSQTAQQRLRALFCWESRTVGVSALRILTKAGTPLPRSQTASAANSLYSQSTTSGATDFPSAEDNDPQDPPSALKALPGSISQTCEGDAPMGSGQDLTRRKRDGLIQGCGLHQCPGLSSSPPSTRRVFRTKQR